MRALCDEDAFRELTDPYLQSVRNQSGGCSRAGPAVVAWFDRSFRALPWRGDPGFPTKDPSFAEVMAGTRRPVDRHVDVDPALASSSVLQRSVDDKIFAKQRGWIYLKEFPGDRRVARGALGRRRVWPSGSQSDGSRCPGPITVLDLGSSGVIG